MHIRNKQVSIYIIIGIMLNSLTIILRHYWGNIPNFISGMGSGLAIGLMILGVLEHRGILPKIKMWKKRILSH